MIQRLKLDYFGEESFMVDTILLKFKMIREYFQLNMI